MLIGQSYAEVRAAFPERDFTGAGQLRGMAEFEIRRFLSKAGYATAERWHSWYLPPPERWIPEPFGALHYAQVDTVPNGGSHLVVVLEDGTVLDPATPAPRRLAEYCDVTCIAAVVPIR